MNGTEEIYKVKLRETVAQIAALEFTPQGYQANPVEHIVVARDALFNKADDLAINVNSYRRHKIGNCVVFSFNTDGGGMIFPLLAWASGQNMTTQLEKRCTGVECICITGSGPIIPLG